MSFKGHNFLRTHKKILLNTLFVFSLNLLQKALGFATVYILIRTLSKDQFGDYQFILSVVGVLTVFSLPGLSNSVMQSTARGMSGTFHHALKPSLLSSLIASLILCAVGTWYLVAKDSNLFLAFYLAAFLFPFTHGLKNWKSLIAGKEKFLSVLYLDGFSALITAILVISTSLAFPGSIVPPLIIVFLIPAIQNTILTGYLLRKIKPCAPTEKGSIKYGIKTTLYSGFNIVANHIDKLLIYSFFSPSTLALYFTADRMSELTKSIAQNLAAVLAPRFAKTENFTKRLDKTLNIISAGLGALIIIFAFSLLPWIMNILFGDDYTQAIPYAQALLCTVAIGNHATLRNRFVNSKLDEKSNRDVILSVSLIRIIASIIFVPLLGILGAVIATFIYRISTVLIINYIVKTRYKLLS